MVSNTSRNGGAIMIGLNRRRTMGSKSGYPADAIMTIESNLEVLAICYAQGWCANSDYITASEARIITNLGTAFKNNTTIKHFNEFEYFGVTNIGNWFNGCTNLESIKLPQTTAVISSYAFQSCLKLKSIEFPTGLTKIEAYAFNGCRNLIQIKSMPMTAPIIVNTSLRSVGNNGTLTIPTSATGYDTWMQNSNYYLGSYGWTKVEF